MKPLTNKTPKDCTTCGKKDPAEIHTCTPKDTIRQEPKTKEEIASSLMEDIECDDTKCPYTKTDGLHFHMERLEEKVVEALTAYRQSVLEEGDCEHDIGSRNDFGCIACGASTDEL